MFKKSFALFLFSSLGIFCSAFPFNTLARSTSTADQFTLYAYGDSIGGLSVFYSQGVAFLGDSSLVNSSDTAPIYFTMSDTSLMVNVNTTAASSSSNVTLSNQMLFVPDSGSSSTNVGFTSSSNATSKSTSGFVFYGNYLFVSSSDTEDALFYAKASDVATGVYSLLWNVTSDTLQESTAISLRTLGPSN